MGCLLSTEKPPPVVLVPPVFHRPQFAWRYRMAESSYDALFGKILRKALFEEHYQEADKLFARIMLKPPEDRNVDFIATFAGRPDDAKNFNGEAIFRWQPDEKDANNFFECKMSTWTQSLKVAYCLFYPRVGLGMFSNASILPTSRLRSSEDATIGLRYGSSNASVGIIGSPAFGPACVWFVGKKGKVTAGCQFKPHQVSVRPQMAWMESFKDELQRPENWSYAIGYGSSKDGLLKPTFNFCLEAQGTGKLVASYYHHLVVQRQVRNPFEGSEVIAITNYLDIGFEFQQSLKEHASDDGASDLELPAMQMGASWQANKNILLKAKLGNASSAVAVLLKSWWQPSFTFSFSAVRNHMQKGTSFGFGVQVENFGGARYEKADPTYVMVTPTKYHVAKEMMLKDGNVRPMLSTNVASGDYRKIPYEFRPEKSIL